LTKNNAGSDKPLQPPANPGIAIADLKVSNSLGLHTHPSTVLAKHVLASGCRVSVTCIASGEVALGHSILALLSLGAAQGTALRVSVEGASAETVLAEILALFAAGFDESTS